MTADWPKAPTYWLEGDTGFASVPFTWNIPEVLAEIQSSLYAKRWCVGGPAVYLQREQFANIPTVTILAEKPGVLQRVNPQATKTSIGCPNKCKFCAVPKTEGALVELDDWPDLPIVCDNNLLACSSKHIDRAFDLLERHEGVDFNQGLDFRKMTPYILERLARLKDAVIRIALDSEKLKRKWAVVVNAMPFFKIKKRQLRSYVLVGFEGTPESDWDRCKFVESKGVLPCPQWFHPLDAKEWMGVTGEQTALGWTKHKQQRLMDYFYQHRDIGEG